MSTAATAFDQQREDRAGRSAVSVAERMFRDGVRFFRALAAEISRIPKYQEDAERLREGLRRV